MTEKMRHGSRRGYSSEEAVRLNRPLKEIRVSLRLARVLTVKTGKRDANPQLFRSRLTPSLAKLDVRWQVKGPVTQARCD